MGRKALHNIFLIHGKQNVPLLHNVPSFRSLAHVSKPGTQCHTSATSLRKQNSKLPCKRPHIRGSAHGRALPPLSQGWRIWRVPVLSLGAYTVSLLCVVSTERGVHKSSSHNLEN